jgi:large subunit ribosomal protein L25
MTDQNTFNIKAQTREITGKKVKALRRAGLVPASIYSHGEQATIISMNAAEFEKVNENAGTSTLVNLKIDDKNAIKVIIKDAQLNPVNGKVIHADFYKVKMDEKIKTEIPLEFVGESDAVAQLDGTLITNKDNIEVECLPNDLVSEIKIDISLLKTFEDQITVADLKLPAGMEVLDDPEEVVCFVEEPRSEEEMAELEESAADEEKEAIEEMNTEAEGEKAEGEADSEEKTDKE